MKVYIYCTKEKSYLINDLNDKIVACFILNQVEKIKRYHAHTNTYLYETNSLDHSELAYKSRLSQWQIEKYLGEKQGYAWHIENLEILDKPMNLSEFKHPFVLCKNYCDNNFIKSFCKDICSHNIDSERLNVWCDRNDKTGEPFTKSPQSWCYANYNNEFCIIISIKPEFVYKILNGEKTIEVRKTVPRGLIKNE